MKIMTVIGNIISQCSHLCLDAGIAVQFKIMQGIIFSQSIGQCTSDGSVVFGDAFQSFPCQVEPVKIRIMTLKVGYNPQRLRIMINPAEGLHQNIERVFACVAKRGMTKIMSQRDRFGQFGIKPQNTRNCAGHLGHLDGMGQAGSKIIPLMFDENLRLVL